MQIILLLLSGKQFHNIRQKKLVDLKMLTKPKFGNVSTTNTVLNPIPTGNRAIRELLLELPAKICNVFTVRTIIKSLDKLTKISIPQPKAIVVSRRVINADLVIIYYLK